LCRARAPLAPTCVVSPKNQGAPLRRATGAQEEALLRGPPHGQGGGARVGTCASPHGARADAQVAASSTARGTTGARGSIVRRRHD
jgi:hypothetical protein